MPDLVELAECADHAGDASEVLDLLPIGGEGRAHVPVEVAALDHPHRRGEFDAIVVDAAKVHWPGSAEAGEGCNRMVDDQVFGFFAEIREVEAQPIEHLGFESSLDLLSALRPEVRVPDGTRRYAARSGRILNGYERAQRRKDRRLPSRFAVGSAKAQGTNL